jgi:hypothetical protein
MWTRHFDDRRGFKFPFRVVSRQWWVSIDQPRGTSGSRFVSRSRACLVIIKEERIEHVLVDAIVFCLKWEDYSLFCW